MKNILIHTIRYTSLLSLGMLTFAGQAFAAPSLTPASVTSLSDTKATIVAKVFNQVSNNTTVWFEWGNTSALGTTIGLTDIYQQGYFQTSLDRLTPGTTYYFRAVALEGGATVYSPVVSFTTTGGAISTTAVSGTYVQPASSAVTYQPAPVQDVVATASRAPEKVSTAEAVVDNSVSPESTFNANSASVIGVGGSILPETLIEWIGLFVAVIIAVILIRMIIESNKKNKEALNQAKLKDLKEAPLTA